MTRPPAGFRRPSSSPGSRRSRSSPARKRRPSRRRAGAAGRQAPSFRAGVELVSLNVTVTDGTARYVTDLEQEDFSVFEDGVKQEVTFFNKTNLPIALALMIDTSASMDARLPTAQEAAIGFVRKLRTQDLAEIIDFDSRVTIASPFTSDGDRAGAGDPQDVGRRLDLAVQRHLHRAQGSQEAGRDQRRGNPAAGDRRAVGRRRHVEPAALRGGARSGQALGDRDLLDRPSLGRLPRPRAGASGRPSSCCGSSRRKPAGGRSSPIRSRNSRTCTARSPTSCRASTRSATRRAIRAVTGPGGASWSA